jgi:hypothetical protein
VTEERNGYLSYAVQSVELGDLTGLSDADHCAEYVGAFNAIIRASGVSFTLKMSDYTLKM